MNARRSILLLAVVATGAAVLAACGGSTSHEATTKAAVPAGAVALVDGMPVLRQDFDHVIGMHLASLKARQLEAPKAGTSEYKALQEQAMLELFQQAVLRAEGAKRGIKVDESIDADTLGKLKKQAGSDAVWNKQLAATASTDADFLNALALHQITEGLQASILKKSGPVTNAEIKVQYDKDKALYNVPASRKVAHILFGPADGSRPLDKDLPKYKKAAEDAIRQLQQGTDFTRLVMRFSTDRQKKANDGVYDVTAKGFDPRFTTAAYALKTGEFTTKPVKSAFGYHVIKALAAPTKDRVKTLSEVAPAIKAKLEDARKGTLYTAWLAGIWSQYEKKTSFAAGYGLPAPTAAAASAAPA